MSTEWSWEKAISRKSDLLEDSVEISKWIAGMGHKVRVTRTDAKAMFAHGAFAQHCERAKVRISHSAPNLKETNGQAERCFRVIMDMTTAFLKIAGMYHRYWPLPIRHAGNAKIFEPPSAPLRGRSPYEMVYGIVPRLHISEIMGTHVSAWIPPN